MSRKLKEVKKGDRHICGGRGNSKRKSPEAAECLVSSRNSMMASVAGVEGVQERVERDRPEREGGAGPGRVCGPLLRRWLLF